MKMKLVMSFMLVMLFSSLAIAGSTIVRAKDTENTASARQFDVVGLRLAMSPLEINQIIKGRSGLRSTESKGSLIYQPSTGGQKRIPGSDYIRVITALENTKYPESITVIFTPTSGREQAISIERKQIFRPDQQPSIDTATDALINKYGQISYKRKLNSTTTELFWRFDDGGLLRDVKQGGIGPTTSDVCGSPSSVIFEYGFDKVSDKTTIQNLLEKYEKCGHTQVRAVLSSHQSTNLVSSLQVYLDGWVNAVSAKRAMQQLIEDFASNQLSKDTSNANRRKPEL